MKEFSVISRSCSLLMLGGMLLVLPLAHAQERTAGSALDAQMSWSALSSQIKSVDVKTEGVISKIDQAILCGKNGKIYAPGAPGADAGGCKDAAVPGSVLTQISNLQTSVTNLTTANTNLSNQVNNSIKCNAAGQFFNGTSCVASTAGLKISSVRMYGSGAYSSNKIVDSGWHSLCVLAFNHNDSNFWLSVIEGPNAQGKARWRASRGAGGAEPMLLCVD